MYGYSIPLITKHETKEQQAVQLGESAYHGLGPGQAGGGAAGPAGGSQSWGASDPAAPWRMMLLSISQKMQGEGTRNQTERLFLSVLSPPVSSSPPLSSSSWGYPTPNQRGLPASDFDLDSSP